MSQTKGKTRYLTFSYQRIDRAISSLNGECFTIKEIHKVTELSTGTISSFLSKKTKKGFLKIIKHGYYRKVSLGDLTQNRPLAFVATKVWEILRQSEKPLTVREISEIIEKNTDLNLYGNISVLLLIWYRGNVLNKFGAKKPYAYQVKPYCKNKGRPLAIQSF